RREGTQRHTSPSLPLHNTCAPRTQVRVLLDAADVAGAAEAAYAWLLGTWRGLDPQALQVCGRLKLLQRAVVAFGVDGGCAYVEHFGQLSCQLFGRAEP